MNHEEQPNEHSVPEASELQERANRIRADLRLLSSDRLDQAFAIGRMLIEWEEEKLGDVVGHKTQEDVISEVGLKRATALSNKRLAKKFDLEQVRHLGLGKLRLLAANFIEDPARIIFDGIEIEDGDRGTKRVSVEDLTYRELRDILKVKKEQTKQPRQSEEETQLAREIEKAIEPALESFEASAGSASAQVVPATTDDVMLESAVPPAHALHDGPTLGKKARHSRSVRSPISPDQLPLPLMDMEPSPEADAPAPPLQPTG